LWARNEEHEGFRACSVIDFPQKLTTGYLPNRSVSFALFSGKGEGVAKWVGILCYWGGGGLLSVKIARDQGRSVGLWAALAFLMGPFAAFLLLALSPRLHLFQRILIIIVPWFICPLLVYGLLAASGQGSFRVVSTESVSGGYDPRFQRGENFCGKVVNVQGEVIATDPKLIPVIPNEPGHSVFALTDGSGEASAREYRKTPYLSLQDRIDLTAAKIVASQHYPPPHVGEHIKVGVIVKCDSLLPGDPSVTYTLTEISRRSLQGNAALQDLRPEEATEHSDADTKAKRQQQHLDELKKELENARRDAATQK
jgi:hypothetical protein